MIARTLLSLILGSSALALGLFLTLFIARNAAGFSALASITVLATLYGLLNVFAFAALRRALRGSDMTAAAGSWLWRCAILLATALLLYVFFDSTVTDYYQPLSLYNDVIAALAAWWGLLILLGLAIAVLPGQQIALRPATCLLIAALAGWPLTASLGYINTPQPGKQVELSTHVFLGGEDGYDIYRIPGFTVIRAGSMLADGNTLATDRLLAFAEARRDGSLDTGVIDLVLKISDDEGASWSGQRVICRHQRDQQRGKCGNPTPLFDSETGQLLLAYNLSGLEQDRRQHSGHLIVSKDGGTSWGAARQIAQDNFVFGPGKGVRKTLAPRAGRLMLPGHLEGTAHLMYSDDHGANWHRGAGLEGGNESDVAELSGGQLYLATRHMAPIAMAPEPNGRQFSLSTDAGASWGHKQLDTRLPTPVCQVAVLPYGESGGLLFSNPAHRKSRVRMTIRYSEDDGSSWGPGQLVYPGPAGYSVLATGSDGAVYLLYENGNMAYSERISLARISAAKLQTSTTVESK